MTKKKFRLNADRIQLLKKSMDNIKHDAVKDIAKEVVNNHLGGNSLSEWGKVIVGHCKHAKSLSTGPIR